MSLDGGRRIGGDAEKPDRIRGIESTLQSKAAKTDKGFMKRPSEDRLETPHAPSLVAAWVEREDPLAKVGDSG